MTDPTPLRAKRGSAPRLHVNDLPRRMENHGFVYDVDRTFPVEVSFVGANGDYWRVAFDPQTGVPTPRKMPREDEL